MANGFDNEGNRPAPRAGTRFRAEGASGPRPAAQAGRTGTRFRSQPSGSIPASQTGSVPPAGVRPAVSAHGRARASQKRTHPGVVVAAVLGTIAVVALVLVVALPQLGYLLAGEGVSTVEAGQPVTVNIPEGSGGDAIASILAQAHVIENPKEYYAAVKNLGADQSLKPGDYALTTHQDPEEVVQQLMAGPNVEGVKLTIQEGLTVKQTAVRVEEVYGIPADEFLAQAKASAYADDYPFLEGAYDDSLEGYLYPKTYTFSGTPTADEVIRALLDQFSRETEGLGLDAGANGLSAQEIVTLASLVERETAVEAERPDVASVIYNRLDIDMPLQIDAAIVYARGGGSDPVTYDDLKIDSPYNIYESYGLTPGPICSPSVSSIKAALAPSETAYLYYVASAKLDGSHVFTDDYAEFERNSAAYSAAVNGE